MKKLALVLASLGLALGLAAGAAAQNKSPRFLGPPVQRPNPINERQRDQQKRIREGVRSGELTRAEAVRLEREQRDTRQLERRVRADGTVTPVERARVQRQLNQSSRHIKRAKHNDRDRD